MHAYRNTISECLIILLAWSTTGLRDSKYLRMYIIIGG